MLASLFLAAVLITQPSDASAEYNNIADLNSRRAAAALGPLQADGRLADVARERAIDMMRRRYFSHTNPDGKTAIDALRTRAYRFSYAGENIALAPSEPIAERALWNSAPHRENILEAHFRRVGVAVVVSPDAQAYVVQIFSD